MSLWFGKTWDAPSCEPESHTDTPVGEPCTECDIAIAAGDQGFLIPVMAEEPRLLAYHRVCFLRTVIPCRMWAEELRADMPEHWAAHWRNHHPEEIA